MPLIKLRPIEQKNIIKNFNYSSTDDSSSIEVINGSITFDGAFQSTLEQITNRAI